MVTAGAALEPDGVAGIAVVVEGILRKAGKHIEPGGGGQIRRVAGKGNGEVRKILVRDKNRLVCVKVLQNPRITDSEVEMYAKSTNVSDDVLRFICLVPQEWLHEATLVPVVRALVQNPQTPLGLSRTHLKRMSVRELDGLSKNRNIPEALRKAAKKMFKQKSQKKNQ